MIKEKKKEDGNKLFNIFLLIGKILNNNVESNIGI